MTTKPATAREIRAAASADRARRDAKRQIRTERTARLGRIAKGLFIAATVATIAVFALTASFAHLRHLCILAGQDASTWYSPANATPIVIDLMMFIASVQLRHTGITGTARWIARLCMTGGLLTSITGNVVDAWLALPAGETLLMVCVRLSASAAPALVLWGAVEMLTHTRKTPKPKARKASLLRRLLVALVTRAEARNVKPAAVAPSGQLAADGI
jgi:hypothetical protein